MEELLRCIANAPEARDVDALIELVDTIRPDRADDGQQASNNLLALSYLLEHDITLRAGLRRYLINVLATRKQAHLYTDTGILNNQGFFTTALQRLGWKILPPDTNDNYTKDIFGRIFHQEDDHEWISAVDDATWLHFFEALHMEEIGDLSPLHHLLHEVLEAMQVLSHRLAAMGLEPELVRNHPAIEQFESAFLAQNREITEYVSEYRQYMQGERSEHQDEKQGLVLLAQCGEVLSKLRKSASKNGVSVSLTYLLARIQQTIARLETLFRLLQTDSQERRTVIINFLRELVAADNRKFSLRDLFSTNTELIALQITEHAGRTGEHYVANTRRGYYEMLRSAMGAGFIVGFMATIKVLTAKLKLAPFGEAFLFSMNYSFGFMLIHVLHFTIATKQPAMTAANIAATIHQTSNQKGDNLEELADLTLSVFRTQFIAIIGNVLLAIPVGFGIAWLFYFSSDHHLADPAKVQHLLHDIDPFHSLAIPHAAIAGVCLFLAGLISGYHDNMAIYNRIPQRLRQVQWLNSLLGGERLGRFTQYVENNLGALAGNFYFGIMLGSMGTLGFILGLPLDIRHITFSSANFAFALAGSNNALPWQTIVVSLFGIACIGLTNLFVSFSLALMVALKSRRVRYRQWLPLAGLMIRRFFRQPAAFFLPPPKALPEPANDTEAKEEPKKSA